jgi:CRISPR-associated protein Csd1
MTVLAALKGCYDCLADDPDSGIAPYGYSPEKISFALIVSGAGEALGFQDLRVNSGRKLAPRTLLVPKDPRITRTSAITANFLWDKTAYALGVTREPRCRRAATTCARSRP